MFRAADGDVRALAAVGEKQSFPWAGAFRSLPGVLRMNMAVRIVLYCVLVCAAAFFSQRFLAGYGQRADQAAQLRQLDNSTNTTTAVPPVESAAQTPGQNVETNTPATETNAAAEAVGGTNTVDAASAPAAPGKPAGSSRVPIGLYAALALALLLAVAILAAYDVSHYVGSRAQRVLFNEEGEGFADPEYDVSEQAWANGEHLEAIRLMREYYATHPREIHVAFRIAEIYEKDLANTLAAALEYEEILRCNLSSERWGWAAIHLCNLYTRLNQNEKSQALLQRIVDEHGDTAAARKARERLGQDEEGGSGEAEAGDGTGPKLPPGFKPRKR
jgi:TolA-binding protein